MDENSENDGEYERALSSSGKGSLVVVLILCSVALDLLSAADAPPTTFSEKVSIIVAEEGDMHGIALNSPSSPSRPSLGAHDVRANGGFA